MYKRQAESISSEKVIFSQNFYINNVQQFIAGLQKTDFYASAKNSYEEAKKKIEILKEYIAVSYTHLDVYKRQLLRRSS